ncbi:hypothetical protein K437DRAFT_170998 [Tilletiaria anomala UBC 951]|uniref:Uncharacterized protein n=1 Tax=Tilletiaria anomala (strain ATCC 24038 / CBS 436.72 / UBC 951) TaxID=1037660 RepID=A0A066VMZ7_TILAU|nr:uncharacterized protein K437DRAFT_170998 [Tilletiaria anomala UBC 951]KDN41663.1 hypothetical protein K437DRAFT_170998 [Tilletiaria anomala UBC 951]
MSFPTSTKKSAKSPHGKVDTSLNGATKSVISGDCQESGAHVTSSSSSPPATQGNTHQPRHAETTSTHHSAAVTARNLAARVASAPKGAKHKVFKSRVRAAGAKAGRLVTEFNGKVVDLSSFNDPHSPANLVVSPRSALSEPDPAAAGTAASCSLESHPPLLTAAFSVDAPSTVRGDGTPAKWPSEAMRMRIDSAAHGAATPQDWHQSYPSSTWSGEHVEQQRRQTKDRLERERQLAELELQQREMMEEHARRLNIFMRDASDLSLRQRVEDYVLLDFEVAQLPRQHDSSFCKRPLHGRRDSQYSSHFADEYSNNDEHRDVLELVQDVIQKTKATSGLRYITLASSTTTPDGSERPIANLPPRSLEERCRQMRSGGWPRSSDELSSSSLLAGDEPEPASSCPGRGNTPHREAWCITPPEGMDHDDFLNLLLQQQETILSQRGDRQPAAAFEWWPSSYTPEQHWSDLWQAAGTGQLIHAVPDPHGDREDDLSSAQQQSSEQPPSSIQEMSDNLDGGASGAASKRAEAKARKNKKKLEKRKAKRARERHDVQQGLAASAMHVNGPRPEPFAVSSGDASTDWQDDELGAGSTLQQSFSGTPHDRERFRPETGFTYEESDVEGNTLAPCTGTPAQRDARVTRWDIPPCNGNSSAASGSSKSSCSEVALQSGTQLFEPSTEPFSDISLRDIEVFSSDLCPQPDSKQPNDLDTKGYSSPDQLSSRPGLDEECIRRPRDASDDGSSNPIISRESAPSFRPQGLTVLCEAQVSEHNPKTAVPSLQENNRLVIDAFHPSYQLHTKAASHFPGHASVLDTVDLLSDVETCSNSAHSDSSEVSLPTYHLLSLLETNGAEERKWLHSLESVEAQEHDAIERFLNDSDEAWRVAMGYPVRIFHEFSPRLLLTQSSSGPIYHAGRIPGAQGFP